MLWFGGGVQRGFKARFFGFHDIIKDFLNLGVMALEMSLTISAKVFHNK